MQAVFFLVFFCVVLSSAVSAETADAEKIKKLDGLFNQLKTQTDVLKHDAVSTYNQNEENRIAALKVKYGICENRYIPQNPSEVQDTLNIAQFKGSTEEKEKLYLDNIAKNPHSPDMQSAYINYLLGEQKLTEAHAILTSAMQQFPTDPKIQFYKDQYIWVIESLKKNPSLTKLDIKIQMTQSVMDYNTAALECRK